MRSRTRPWLVAAVVANAVLVVVALVMLVAVAASFGELVLIAFLTVSVVSLVLTAAATVRVANLVRARERQRLARLGALERRIGGAADVAMLKEHLEEFAEPARHRADELGARIGTAERALERLDARVAAGDRSHAQQAAETARTKQIAQEFGAAVEPFRAVLAAVQRSVSALEAGGGPSAFGSRLDELEARTVNAASANELSRAISVVDGVVTLASRQGLSVTDVVARPLAAQRVAAAVRDGDPLRAIPYIDAYPDLIGELGNAELRGLLKALRRAGYTRRALPVIEQLASRMGKRSDKEAAQIMASELALYEGELDGDHALPPIEGALHADVVLHVVGKALPATQSGYTLRTHYTVEAQQRVGIRPMVVAHSGSSADAGDETRRYEHGSVPYVLLGGPERGRVPWDEWLAVNIAALAAVVRDVRPAVLHVHSDFMNALIALPVARAYGIPLVNETRGFWEESWLSRTAAAAGWSDIDEIAERWGLPDMYRLRVEREAAARSQSDAVVTLARVMEQHIHDVAERLNLSVPHVSLAPNAVDASNFEPMTPDAVLRASVGLRSGSLVVGYISSIVEYEGIDTLVRGVHELQTARTGQATATSALGQAAAQMGARDVQLLIVGDGPELDGLRQLATSLGVDAIFPGRVPHEEVRGYYALIDLFVVPRRRAAVTELVTPLKPFEAMAAGLPCLFSDVSALAEIAEDSGAAALFRADDSGDLALRLAELLSDESALRQMGEQGARWARAERTWDANASVYLRVYSNLGLRLPVRSSELR